MATYICSSTTSSGKKSAWVLYFQEGSKKPSMIFQAIKPGTNRPINGSNFTGCLFECDMSSGSPEGDLNLDWMIDLKKDPDPDTQVGWATRVKPSVGPADTWKMVRVVASDDKVIYIADGTKYANTYVVQSRGVLSVEHLRANL
ncbi:uncharacterized protein A1O5_01849 [Cladophialophora psammophila CBS 110553]|uniref:Uncharacterized protein n=1 Tax=Cladophialophora psammophila CBS 110553 TaxID=1182543 RepID=W9X4L3_9EURO|nr:uncharacterized protein A1O5_01849 [Cladophialophora psammophila CBS 110553]EXJ75153.1 hypothetical protein A1O5_01849 [Cladophialophora psammophila CBS 110553]